MTVRVWSCVLAVVAALAAAPAPAQPLNASAYEELLFQALAQNDFARVREIAGVLPRDAVYATAREGAALGAWADLRWERAAEAWFRSAEDAPRAGHLEALLHLLDRARAEIPIGDRFRRLLERLKADPQLAPGPRRAVAQQLFRLHLDAGRWNEAQALLSDLGQIGRWWYVVGTFSRFGTMDVNEPFPPERDLSRESYLGFYHTVSWRPAPPTPLGWLSLKGQVHPDEGWSYALTAIEAQSADQAILEVRTGDDVVAWWNGNPVLLAFRTGLHTRNVHRVPVEVAGGLNWVLVKLRKQAGHSVAVRVYRPDGSPLLFRSLEPSRETMASMRVIPGRPVEPAPTADREPRSASDLGAWLALIHDALLAGSDQDFAREKRLLRAAAASLPNSIVPELLLGESNLREARVKTESRTRLQRDAIERFNTVATRVPENPWAAWRLAEDHLERQRATVALNAIERSLGCPVPATAETAQTARSLPVSAWRTAAQACAALGLEPERLASLRTALAANPESLDARRDLAKALSDSHHGPAALALWQEAPGSRTLEDADVRTVAGLLAHQGRAPEAIALVSDRLAVRPADLDLRLQLAALHLRSGDLAAALEAARETTQRCPDAPQAWLDLARVALLAGDAETAAEAAFAALELVPGDPGAQGLLRQLDRLPPDFSAPYDVALRDVDRSRIEEWRSTRASLVYLIDVLVERIERTHAFERYTHQAIELLDRVGVEQFGELPLPQGADLLYARTWLPDGRVLVPEQVHLSEDQTVVSLYGLEVGVIVEYAYLERGKGQANGGTGYERIDFHFGAVNDPVALSRLVVLAPPEMPLVWAANPPDFAPQESARDNRRVLQWERHNIDGVKPEAFRPSLAEIVPSVTLLTLPDWSRELPHIDARRVGRHEPDPRLAETAASIPGTGDPDPLVRARAVYRFVQENIDTQDGGRTDLDALVGRTGTPLARQALLLQLLSECGVRNRPAFLYDLEADSILTLLPRLHPGRREAILVGGPLGAEPLPPFGRPAERNPLAAAGYWLDVPSRHASFGALPDSRTDDYALVVTPRGHMLRPVDLDAWPIGRIRQLFDVQLGSTGDAEVRGRILYEGAGAGVVRRQLTDPQLRERFINQQVVASGLRGVLARRAELFGLTDPDAELFLDFEGSWPSAMQRRQDTWGFRPVILPVEVSDYVQEASRQYPLDLRAEARTIDLVVSYVLPEGAGLVWDRPPDDLLILDKLLGYCLTYRQEGLRMTVCRSLVLRPGIVPLDEYTSFTAHCGKIDAAERAPLSALIVEP